jgi:hypothetical protein
MMKKYRKKWDEAEMEKKGEKK